MTSTPSLRSMLYNSLNLTSHLTDVIFSPVFVVCNVILLTSPPALTLAQVCKRSPHSLSTTFHLQTSDHPSSIRRRVRALDQQNHLLVILYFHPSHHHRLRRFRTFTRSAIASTMPAFVLYNSSYGRPIIVSPVCILLGTVRRSQYHRTTIASIKHICTCTIFRFL